MTFETTTAYIKPRRESRNLARAYSTPDHRFTVPACLAGVVTLAALVAPAVPEAWTDGYSIGPFFIAGSLWGVASLVAVSLCAIRSRHNLASIVGAIGLVIMTALGAIVSAGSPYGTGALVSDTVIFAGFPIGAAFAACTRRSERRMFLSVTYSLNWLILALTNLLLVTHALEPAYQGPRTFVYSEFNCTWALCVLTPVLHLDKTLWEGPAKLLPKTAALATTVLLIATILVSATRSVLIQLAAAIVLIVLGGLKFRSIKPRSVILASVAVLATFVASASSVMTGSFDPSVILDRISTTQLGKEDRIAELRALESQYGTSLIWGRGLGSEFESVVYFKGSDLTVAPHIAIFTLLMKGGLVAFAAGVLVPLIWTVRTLITTRRSDTFAACAGVTTYFLFSSISGGWTFPALFLYGFLLSASLSLSSRNRHKTHHPCALSASVL